ncbi:hypothetical protein [Roseobacter sp. CCS2]|uniref:hypothetical protein n=1 Tax=Roseobacter sp. CCS2 TaxID=391593 RepID=UPI0000F40017|nr:hypothetical protein [Roseobacter sp. CCS2]EBA13517.1 hypothetical protein RCCS2_06509 [Roseobacter sp. CCS2]
MSTLFSDALFLPALVLGLVSFAVPRVLARALPEGVKPLMLNAFLSTILLFVLSALFFFCLYLWQGLSIAEVLEPGVVTSVALFGRLGLIAALIWAPIMVLSVASLPRKWVKETW